MSEQTQPFAEAARTGRPGRKPRARLDGDDRFDDERGQNEREVTEDRDLSEDERFEFFVSTQHQSVLPNPPRITGYHTCWLTTTNARDSIHWRQSIGYELVSVGDCPGWESIGSQEAKYSGVVGINEMLLARIPLSLYTRYMRAMGEQEPLEQEQKLRAQTNLIRERAARRNLQVIEGDGTADVVQRADPMPVFTE